MQKLVAQPQQPTQVSNQASLTPVQVQGGWIENLRTERRTQIESLQKAIELPETVDKDRARRLLEATLEQEQEIEKRFKQGPQDAAQPQKSRNEAVPFNLVMRNMRNQVFMDPFDEFDPHHRISGRKAFAPATTRSMQSRITLKFKDIPAKQREKEKIYVRPDFIDKFNKDYSLQCNYRKLNQDFKQVSQINPFSPDNQPPREHIVPEKILDKPGAIQNLQQLKDKKPLAGRFTDIGQRIFSLGNKASQICTGPWYELSMVDDPTKPQKQKPITLDPSKIAYKPAENHTYLHAAYVAPAYFTNADVSYCGRRSDLRIPEISPANSARNSSNMFELPVTQNPLSPTHIRMSPTREQFLSRAKENRALRKIQLTKKDISDDLWSPRGTEQAFDVTGRNISNAQTSMRGLKAKRYSVPNTQRYSEMRDLIKNGQGMLNA